MSKFFTILALGLLTLNVFAPAAFAGNDRSALSQNNVLFEKPECPEGEDWNEEKKACEKKTEVKQTFVLKVIKIAAFFKVAIFFIK